MKQMHQGITGAPSPWNNLGCALSSPSDPLARPSGAIIAWSESSRRAT